MPSVDEHCDDCTRILGKPYKHVHRWLDEFAGNSKMHRSIRHNSKGIEEVRKRWGKEAAEAARIHIDKDNRDLITSIGKYRPKEKDMKMKIKRRKKMIEENPKKRKEFNQDVYKPKFLTTDEMHQSMKKAFSESQQKQKAIPIFNQTQKYPQPKSGKPMFPKYQQKSLNAFRQQVSEPPQPEQPKEEEPYWSPEEWESWALAVYKEYPDLRNFLPEWFVQAVDE